MSDEPEVTESPAEAPEGAEPEGGGVAVAVREEVSPPAVPMGPAVDPRAEARKSRFLLPLLIPLGAILTVAFVALNVSRVFLAASEGSRTPAVIVAAGITVTILLGATVIAAIPGIRTSSLIVGMAGVMLVVLLAGSLVLGASLPKSKKAAGYVEPAGKAINTLAIDALPTLSFQAKSFNVPAGINLIQYVDKGGSHTLVFDQNAVPGFQLAVPNGQSASKVDLQQGKTYTVYCTIPGHRAAGMQANIVVGAPGGKPIAGTQSPTATTAPAGTTPTSNPGTAPGSPASQSSSGSGG
jgi:plastocyanin